MKSERLNKVARLIQKDLSDIFLSYGKNLHVLISVSEVRVTSDLAIASAYLSIYPTTAAHAIMENIETEKGKIRKNLGERERHQLRIIPELRFYLDETLSKLEHIETLLKNDK